MSTIKVNKIENTSTTAGGVSINNQGNVGIGVTTPADTLHVRGPVSGTILNLDRAGSYSWKLGQSSGSDLTFTGDTSERVRFTVDGKLLVGTSTDRFGTKLLVESIGGDSGATFARNSNDSGSSYSFFIKSRGTSVGSNTIVQSGDTLGFIGFYGTDGTGPISGASIAAQVDGTPGTNDMPGRLVFSTTADGASSPTERMRITNDGSFYVYSVYSQTGGASANVVVDSAGEIFRSTSSIKYKTNVETIEDFYADALLNIRPVWYRSTCDIDNPAHSFWGFIAEEVAEVDPRLVHWKTSEPVVQEDGSLEHVPCDPEPEGVQYDRFVPHLLNLIKRQKEQIEAQGTAIAALEARLSALEAS